MPGRGLGRGDRAEHCAPNEDRAVYLNVAQTRQFRAANTATVYT